MLTHAWLATLWRLPALAALSGTALHGTSLARPSLVLIVLSLLVSFGVTVVCVPPTRRLAVRLGLVDRPNPRKIHSAPMPMLGGLPIFAGISTTFLFLWTAGGLPSLAPGAGRDILALLAGGLVSLILGVVDEKVTLHPWPHLLGQIAAALAAMAFLPLSPQLLLGAGPHAALRLQGLGPLVHLLGLSSGDLAAVQACPAPPLNCAPLNTPILGVLTIGFVLFWIVGMMNTINWLDGLDGLASGMVAIAGFALAGMAIVAHPPQSADAWLVPLAISGACLGFLVFNWNPARIFLADSGAQLLGVLLGVASLVGGAKLGTAMIVLGLPILDVAWLIVRRVASGHAPGAADNRHLHHRMLASGLTQRQAVSLFYVMSVLFGVAALSNSSVPDKLKTMVVLVVVMAGLIVVLGRRAQRRTEAPNGQTPLTDRR